MIHNTDETNDCYWLMQSCFIMLGCAPTLKKAYYNTVCHAGHTVGTHSSCLLCPLTDPCHIGLWKHTDVHTTNSPTMYCSEYFPIVVTTGKYNSVFAVWQKVRDSSFPNLCQSVNHTCLTCLIFIHLAVNLRLDTGLFCKVSLLRFGRELSKEKGKGTSTEQGNAFANADMPGDADAPGVVLACTSVLTGLHGPSEKG